MTEPIHRPDSSGSRRRWLLPVGIALSALAVLAVVLWFRPSPTDNASAPPIARSSSEFQKQHADAVAEARREEQERSKPLSEAESREQIVNSPTLTPEQKQVILDSREKMARIAEASEAEQKAFLEAQEKDRLRTQQRLKAQEEARDKEKEKRRLTFTVEAAPAAILPCQPLSVRFRLTNSGEEPVALTFSLDPQLGDISAEAAPAGSDNFRKLFLARFTEKPVTQERNAPVLAPGSSITWQAELSPFLGYDAATNSAAATTQTVRISLNAEDRNGGVLKAPDFTVTVVAPTGDDQSILVRMLKENLLSFLGTQSMKTSPQSWPGDSASALTAIRAVIDQYPEAAYSRHLRAGFVTLMSGTWTSLLKQEQKETLKAKAKAVADEFWRRDQPESWAHAETLLPLARLCNFAGDPAKEKDALGRFVQLCPDDPRAEAARQALQRR